MKINFATKRGANGLRKLLLIDTDKREYSRESAHWFCREDFTEISITDFRKIEERAVKEGFLRVDYMTP